MENNQQKKYLGNGYSNNTGNLNRNQGNRNQEPLAIGNESYKGRSRKKYN